MASVRNRIGQDNCVNRLRSRLAVNVTNSAETMRTTSDSLKRASSSMPGMRRLASAMPKIVAAARPAPSITSPDSV